MSSRSVSDIQTRAEGESMYIRYRSDANLCYIMRIYARLCEFMRYYANLCDIGCDI